MRLRLSARLDRGPEISGATTPKGALFHATIADLAKASIRDETAAATAAATPCVAATRPVRWRDSPAGGVTRRPSSCRGSRRVRRLDAAAGTSTSCGLTLQPRPGAGPPRRAPQGSRVLPNPGAARQVAAAARGRAPPRSPGLSAFNVPRPGAGTPLPPDSQSANPPTTTGPCPHLPGPGLPSRRQ